MIPRPAQYLLRFDDLCPTMSRSGWERFALLIEEFGIQPILAVVPDNRDCELMVSPHDPEFWSRMRSFESSGATIALHGYQHLCESRGKSILGLHQKTEFAGIAEDVQRQWIRSGLEILRGYELNPKLWVAPRHGFDAATLSALRKEGIDFISDGFARTVAIRGGVRWIPQQLWEPALRSEGLWTICIHTNTASDSMVQTLRDFLSAHKAQFTSFDRVVSEHRAAELEWSERLYAWASRSRLRIANRVRRLGRRTMGK
jgi:predicted deacetylase